MNGQEDNNKKGDDDGVSARKRKNDNKNDDSKGNGRDFVVDKLTGARAMKRGKVVYEVKWEGTNENTWEPAVNLVHHVKEMAEIDKNMILML